MRKLLKSAQSGMAFIEAAIVLPLLLLLAFAAADLFFLATTYLSLRDTAREAVISGSLPAAQDFAAAPDPNPTPETYQSCFGTTPPPDCGGIIIGWRVRRLIEAQRLRIDPATVQVNSTAQPPAVGLNLITVELSATFSGFFSVFGGLPLRVTVTDVAE